MLKSTFLQHIFRKNTFFISVVFFILSTVSGYTIYNSVKKLQVFSDVNFDSKSVKEVKAGEEFSFEITPKTDSLYSLHIPICSTSDLNYGNFSITPVKENTPMFITTLSNRDSGNKILMLTFAEATTCTEFKITCNTDLKYFLNSDGTIQNKQYGIPRKYARLFIIAFALLCIFVFFIVKLVNFLVKNIAVKYLIFSILIGLCCIVVLPAFTIPDERVHYNAAYNLSNVWQGEKDYFSDWTLTMRECDNRIYPPEISDNRLFTRQLHEIFDSITDYKKYYFYALPNISKKSENTSEINHWTFALGKSFRIYYIPHAIGITISKKLNMNQYQLYYLSCVLALIFNTLIIFTALLKTKCKNTLIFFFAMTPFLMQQMSHFTYDGTIYTLTVAFIIYILSLNQKRKISDFILSFVCLLCLYPAKNHAYLVLGFLYTLPLQEKIKILFATNKKAFLSLFAYLVFAAVLAYTAFKINYKPDYIQLYDMAWTTPKDLGVRRIWNLAHPIEFSVKALATLNTRLIECLKILYGFIVGANEIHLKSFTTIGLLCMGFLALTDKNTEIFSRKQKLPIFGIVFLFLTGVCAGNDPKVSSIYLQAVEGRYFIPFGILILSLVNTEQIRFGKEHDNMSIIMHGFPLLSFLIWMDVLAQILG